MRENAVTERGMSEAQFAALVDRLAADPTQHGQLTDLLREENPLYEQRGTATIVRMRGWILLALARVGLPDTALIFVLEELDTGTDAYLVAAASHALRSYRMPSAALAPFVIRAIANIRYYDELVSFEKYGEYSVSSAAGTSPIRELLATLTWLGPHAREVIHDVESLREKHCGLPKKFHKDVNQAVRKIRGNDQVNDINAEKCCTLPNGLSNKLSWTFGLRRGCEQPVESIVFEDHESKQITFSEFFEGHPSVVVFFYTRCDNPLKCSLTITKLARVQELLKESNFDEQIQTAAITYDPAFDTPKRLRAYADNRSVYLNARHKMLRTTSGFDALRSYFKLGVNFIESLVNRHCVEVYVLDAEGKIVASFERLHWEERQVVDCVIEVLKEKCDKTKSEETSVKSVNPATRRKTTPLMLGTLASVGLAFFPKCPICWIGYMSFFGIAGLEQIPYSPWLQPVLIAVMLINLASVWLRGRSTGRMNSFYLVVVGVFLIVASKMVINAESIALCGIAATFAGSLLSAVNGMKGKLKESPELV